MTLQALESRPLLAPRAGERLYVFEAGLAAPLVVGLLPEGVRMDVPFEGRITEGALAGASIKGTDHLLVRPDGVGVIDAPETISLGEIHVSARARGYVIPPPGVVLPSLDALLGPEPSWPEGRFDVRGFALLRTASPSLEPLNRSVALLRGYVDMRSGRLEVEATAV